jgi:hypothetical protein
MKIAFDCDYTLVDEQYNPIYDNIDLYRWFERHGWDCIIWSGGGVDYAQHIASKLGLKGRVVDKCSESVDIAVDDSMPLGEQWGGRLQAKVVITV